MKLEEKTQRIERRFHRGIELRAQADDKLPLITGYAALFNSMSVDLGGFMEVIEPGAFSNVLADTNLVCKDLFNHDANIVVASTDNKTLTLRQDDKGLYIEADPLNTQLIRDMVIAPIQRGDVNGMSIAFMVESADWSETFQSMPVRRITSFSLLDDVSQVTYPAYPATSIQMRSLLGAVPTVEEIRALIESETRQEWHGIDIERARLDRRMRKFRLFNQ